jgi:hypothetical protein
MSSKIVGSSTELYARMLARNPALTKSACSGPQACGTYLTRLVKSGDYPITVAHKHKKRREYTFTLREDMGGVSSI